MFAPGNVVRFTVRQVFNAQECLNVFYYEMNDPFTSSITAAQLGAMIERIAAQHAADVAAAVAGERERAVAVCRAVADGWERASVTAKVDTGLALIRAEGATECADALAAPTGGGE